MKNADVTYYIYRSRYYPWWWERDEDDEQDENEGGDESSYGYGNDMVKDGQEKLNANGKLEVEFEVPAAEEKSAYEYRVTKPGSIYIKTIVKEGKSRFVATDNYLWVADRADQWSDWAYADSGSIKLVPDKKSYQPGETAHVLAMLPTAKAHLLVTMELSGVMNARESTPTPAQ